jgi:hypothetical protein
MKKIFLKLYAQLTGDITFKELVSYEGNHLGLIDFGHRIPGLVFLTQNTEIFPSFKALLQLAIIILEEEPGELLCCDTDMDSYSIIPIHDIHHANYKACLKNQEEFVQSLDTSNPWMALIIEPLDYHS